MRKNASMVVQSISGHRGKSCYYVLTQAVTVAVLCMPSEPQMKVICTEAGRLCGKSTAAVWKALSRALDDIWQCGDRDAGVGIFPAGKTLAARSGAVAGLSSLVQ